MAGPIIPNAGKPKSPLIKTGVIIKPTTIVKPDAISGVVLSPTPRKMEV